MTALTPALAFRDPIMAAYRCYGVVAARRGDNDKELWRRLLIRRHSCPTCARLELSFEV